MAADEFPLGEMLHPDDAVYLGFSEFYFFVFYGYHIPSYIVVE